MSASELFRVACVGASITFGLGLTNRREEAYPSVLARLLGHGCHVRNFGYSGATAGRRTNEPYWETPSLLAASRFTPQLVVISFGVNDAQHANLENLPDFHDDFVALAEHFRLLDSRPQVVIKTPSPVFPPLTEIDREVLDNDIRPTIESIAHELGFPLIDGFSPLVDRSELFPDNLHPNAEGARLLAEAVFAVVEPLILQ